MVIKNGKLIINEQIPVSVSDRNIYMRVDIMWKMQDIQVIGNWVYMGITALLMYQ